MNEETRKDLHVDLTYLLRALKVIEERMTNLYDRIHAVREAYATPGGTATPEPEPIDEEPYDDPLVEYDRMRRHDYTSDYAPQDLLTDDFPVTEKEPKKTPQEEWTAYFGLDVYEHGYPAYYAARVLKDSLSLRWDEVTKLLSAAPVYAEEGAPKPPTPNTIPNMKYPPRRYEKEDGLYTWFYPLKDAQRMNAIQEAASYWIDRLGITNE